MELINGNLTAKLENVAGGGGGTALIADAVRLELTPEPATAVLGGLGLLPSCAAGAIERHPAGDRLGTTGC